MFVILKILLAICFAYWCKKETFNFAKRINQQIYDEYRSLIKVDISLDEFQCYSSLQPKKSCFANLFFILFPLIFLLSGDVVIAIISVLLLFLALLDIQYYLTDIRAIAFIFLLSLTKGELDTIYFLIGLFVIIQIVSFFILKKEGMGLGDYLLLLALSPLFNIEQILCLIFIASLFGLFFYFVYRLIKKQKLEKLPFIPFIMASTFILFIDKI